MKRTLDGVADALSTAGVRVRVITPRHVSRIEWQLQSVMIHHDATRPGPSDISDYLYRQARMNKPSSQLWVSYAGVWHVITHGWAAHAGVVRRSVWTNANSAGVETDHTTGEAWPVKQYDSLVTGTAALLKFGGLSVTEETLTFHKIACKPLGRKVDPDGITYGTFLEQVASVLGRRPRTVVAVDGKFGPHTISVLQRALKFRGLYPGTVDGKFGPMTKRGLQSLIGVTADGKFGPISTRALRTFLGLPHTGRWDATVTRALQNWLNASDFVSMLS